MTFKIEISQFYDYSEPNNGQYDIIFYWSQKT